MTQIPLPQLSVAPLCSLQHDALRCFVCGGGASTGKLVGSGNARDWVHLNCLAAPLDWGAEEKTS
jgi:hypothetical protein